MTRDELTDQIREKQSLLCVGLDPDLRKLPAPFKAGRPEDILSFNRAIIDATRDLCVAYKLNLAFFEVLGSKGWEILEETLAYIPDTHFTIADAKRGDIGNTASQYARTYFETYDFDALTVAPYMGADSVLPFLEFSGKWIILLGLTSNPGSQDFQFLPCRESYLFEEVIRKATSWGNPDNLMFVVGATQSAHLQLVRELAPSHFFLVPGVGAQGGSLEEVCRTGLLPDGGLLINSSRGILYAGQGDDFADRSREAALQLQQEMAVYCEQVR